MAIIAGVQDIIEKFEATIRRHDLLPERGCVVLAVSGGPDSLALLHLMREVRDRSYPRLALHVGHLHHGMRGAAADEDAQFVDSEAARLGVACTIERADVPALAARAPDGDRGRRPRGALSIPDAAGEIARRRRHRLRTPGGRSGGDGPHARDPRRGSARDGRDSVRPPGRRRARNPRHPSPARLFAARNRSVHSPSADSARGWTRPTSPGNIFGTACAGSPFRK